MKNTIPVYAGSLFKWAKNHGTSSCSSMGVHANELPFVILPQFVGFVVESHKTGKRLNFALSKVERDDLDVVEWMFETADRKFRVSILND